MAIKELQDAYGQIATNGINENAEEFSAPVIIIIS